jgi:hypothetical protein
MKRCLLLALAGLAIGLTMPTLAQPNESAPSEQDRQQLDALAARYAEAANRHDAAAIVSLFTDALWPAVRTHGAALRPSRPVPGGC